MINFNWKWTEIYDNIFERMIFPMKMRLIRSLGNEKEDNNMNESQQLSDEELAEQARIKMGNLDMFPSLSNKQKEKEESKNLWSFSPVIPVMREGKVSKFTISLSAYDLATLYENETLIVVPSVQRGQKLTSSGKLKDIVSQKHINEMLENATKGRMFGGTIILNSSSEIEYDPDLQIISGNTPLQIIDGMHRTKMSVKWKKLAKKNEINFNSPKNYEFTVSIEQLSDEQDAKALFAEANSYSLKVNKTRTSYLDVNSTANQIVQSIMKSSDLKNKIETVSTVIRSSSPNLVTFGSLVNAVKSNYNPQTKKEQEQDTDYLIKYIDELVNIFPKFMTNPDINIRNELKSQYFTIEPLAWNGFIALSKVLQNQEHWERRLSKLDSKVEFQGWKGDFLNRENPIFRKILRENNRIINTTSSMKWINTVFIKFVAENKTLDEIASEDK
jgi:hypothetical protein